MDEADCIFYLHHKYLIQQFYYIIKRGINRKENILKTIRLCIHAFHKRYGLEIGKIPMRKLIRDHQEKVIEISSWKEIHYIIDNI